MQDPFKPAQKQNKRVKLLIYGEPGAGKTTLALQLQRVTGGKVALIDTEGGADLYAGADGMPEFNVLRTKNYDEIVRALEFIGTVKHEYTLLVIDPITVIWNIIIEGVQLLRENAARKQGKEADTASLTIKDWGVIKRKMNKIYNMLVNLPINVVVTAREKEEYEGEGDNRKRVGSKPDAEKSLDYLFDGILHLSRDHKGVRYAMVKKDRSGQLKPRIEGVTPDSLKALFDRTQDGADYHLPSEADAAAALAATVAYEENQQATPPPPAYNPKAVWDYATGKGLSKDELLAALGVAGSSQYKGTDETARAAIDAFVVKRVQDTPAPVEPANPQASEPPQEKRGIRLPRLQN